MKRKLLIISLIVVVVAGAIAFYIYHRQQAKKTEVVYAAPEDPAVIEKLEQWSDLKFGVIMHWGLYSELGIVESWTICSDPQDWIPRDSTLDYTEYKKWYWDTADRFAPVDYDPDSWAEICKNAGFKYLIFTSKHHDGFNMFDSKFTDFSISKHGLKDHPKANVVKEVFDAFRKKDFMIGLYFSKPDWHSEYYWWPRYATPARTVNYPMENHNWRWEKFEEFTFNQLDELTDGSYGDIDILWLDGGWVVAASEHDMERRKSGEPYRRQGLDMDKLASIVRGNQEGLIMVNRMSSLKYQDYMTPEREHSMFQHQQTKAPWEASIPLAQDWGYTPMNIQKSSAEVIQYLAEVVAKGGNMLLGIGPDGKGVFPEDVLNRLDEIGKWLEVNGEAIYNTRPTKVYHDEQAATWFTQSKDGGTIYAMTCFDTDLGIPDKIVLEEFTTPATDSEIICLYTGKPVEWAINKKMLEITVPEGIPADYPMVAFSYKRK